MLAELLGSLEDIASREITLAEIVGRVPKEPPAFPAGSEGRFKGLRKPKSIYVARPAHWDVNRGAGSQELWHAAAGNQ